MRAASVLPQGNRDDSLKSIVRSNDALSLQKLPDARLPSPHLFAELGFIRTTVHAVANTSLPRRAKILRARNLLLYSKKRVKERKIRAWSHIFVLRWNTEKKTSDWVLVHHVEH